jgi:5-formyltetrahydrofolate cyclo-ligase
MNKNQLRQDIRLKRRALSAEFQQKASLSICKQVSHLNRFRLSEHIAFYLPSQGEIDPLPILEEAQRAGKHCYLPLLHPHQINTLLFMPYKVGDPLIENRYHILEPAYQQDKHFSVAQLDIVFVPLVAFDKDNQRLGMGKGYYDRTFAFLQQSKKDKPYLIGLAYRMQAVETLITEPHDVRLHHIITERIL